MAPSSRRRISLAVALTCLLSVAAAAPGQAAAKKPDLTVSSFSGPLAATAGAKLRLADKTSNSGGTARASSTAIFLSRDRRRGKDVRIGARKVAALKPRASSEGGALASIPRKAKPGRYFVLACADGGEKVAETNERNNCRASKRTHVLAAFKPRPLNVSAVPDAARAETKIVTTEGDALFATSSNGTKFALVVPKDALSSSEQISITPLSAINGLPFKAGLSGGVLLEPSGLSFNRPVTVRIVPAKAVPLSRRATFSFAGSGKDFHLYPVTQRDGALDFELTHFTGVGLAAATEPEFDGQGRRVPTTREAWTRQLLHELIREVAEGGGSDPVQDRKFVEASELALFVWGNEGVLPLATAAATNASLFDKAASEYAAWERQQALLDASAPALRALKARIVAQLKLGFENAVKQAYAACLEGDFRQPLRLLDFLRQVALNNSFGADITNFTEMITSCVRFELDYEFEWTEDNGQWVTTGRAGVRGVLLTGGLLAPVAGQKELDFVNVEIADPVCSWTVNPEQDAPFSVTGIEFDLNRFPPRFLILRGSPGGVLEHVTQSCPEGEHYSDTFRLYNGAFSWLHSGTEANLFRFAIGRWDQIGGNPYANTIRGGSAFDPSAGGTTYEGASTWELRHVPLRTGG